MKIGGQPPQPPISPKSDPTQKQDESVSTKSAETTVSRNTMDASLQQAAEQRDQALSSDFAKLVGQPGPPSESQQAFQKNLQQLGHCHESFRDSAAKMGHLFETLSQKVSEVAGMATQETSTDQLFQATQQMQEMNQSFNLQYLELQNNMQAENRQFTLLSNIMKSKHDTAKNAIDNIR